MAQIKFYRGASGVTLPAYQNGAVFIVANASTKDGMSLGDMYVDVDGEQRLHIVPNDVIYYKAGTSALNGDWGDTRSVANQIYVWIDENRKPKIAVGDGTTKVKNLTFYSLYGAEAASSVSSISTVSAVGTAATFAREDHVHNINVFTGTTSGTISIAGQEVAVAGLGSAAYTSASTYPTAAFNKVKVGTTTIAASGTASTLSISAGSNINLTSDINNGKITISANIPNHADYDSTYGLGTENLYGHVKLSDVTDGTASSSDGVAATPKAVADAAAATLSAAQSYANDFQNQNAFANVKVGSSTIGADNTQSTVELVQGNNIQLTANTSQKKVTISATNTTYSASTTAAKPISTTASAGTTAADTAYAAWDHVHNITSATITSALGYIPVNPQDLPSGSMVFKGVTTATITAGSTTKPTDIYTGTNIQKLGDVIAYGSKEFVWGGATPHWIEFGDFSDLANTLGDLAYKSSASASYTPSGSITVTLPTASINAVSQVSTASIGKVNSVSTTAFVKSVTTAAQTMVTGVTTASQTIATGGTTTAITVSGELLIIPSAVITTLSTASINKVTAVSTASKNVVSSVTTDNAVSSVTTASQTVVTAVTTAAKTTVNGQPTTASFSGTAATITVA